MGNGSGIFSILFLIGTDLIILPISKGVAVPKIKSALLISSTVMLEFVMRFLEMMDLKFCVLGYPISC